MAVVAGRSERKHESKAPPVDPRGAALSPNGGVNLVYRGVNVFELDLKSNELLLSELPPFRRLQRRVDAWAEIGASQLVLTIIRNGVRIPLKAMPRPMGKRMRGNLTAELLKLEGMGVIRTLSWEESASTKTWTPIFAVPKPDKSIRLITDVRNLNSVLKTPKFRADTIHSALKAAVGMSWATRLDLKDYFFNVPFHQSARRWVRVPGPSQCHPGYEWTSLCFGFAASPFWTAKLASPVLQKFREDGLNITWYVDDILILATTEEQCQRDTSHVVHVLTKLGLALNQKKCQLTPVNTIQYLGLELNLLQQQVKIPDTVQLQLQQLCASLARKSSSIPKAMSSLGGKLNYFALGHQRLFGWAKHLMAVAGRHAQGKSHLYWTPFHLEPNLRHLLGYLSHQLKKSSPNLIKNPNIAANLIVFSDASDLGWGCVMYQPTLMPTGPLRPETPLSHLEWRKMVSGVHTRVPATVPLSSRRVVKDCPGRKPTGQTLGNMYTNLAVGQQVKNCTMDKDPYLPPSAQEVARLGQKWNQRQSRLHITAQEALGANLALMAAIRYLIRWDKPGVTPPRRHIVLVTDSVATRAAVEKGSSKRPINWAIQDALAFATQANVQITALWTASANNPADEPSRRVVRLREDWQLKPAIMHQTLRVLGVMPTLDLFASPTNANFPRFVSHKAAVGAFLVNAMAHNWHRLELHHVLWANPPFSLIPAIISKIRAEKVKTLVLVTPVWPKAPWYHTVELLTVRKVVIPKGTSIYLRQGLIEAPPPRWATEVRVVSGLRLGNVVPAAATLVRV